MGQNCTGVVGWRDRLSHQAVLWQRMINALQATSACSLRWCRPVERSCDQMRAEEWSVLSRLGSRSRCRCTRWSWEGIYAVNKLLFPIQNPASSGAEVKTTPSCWPGASFVHAVVSRWGPCAPFRQIPLFFSSPDWSFSIQCTPKSPCSLCVGLCVICSKLAARL